ATIDQSARCDDVVDRRVRTAGAIDQIEIVNVGVIVNNVGSIASTPLVDGAMQCVIVSFVAFCRPTSTPGRHLWRTSDGSHRRWRRFAVFSRFHKFSFRTPAATTRGKIHPGPGYFCVLRGLSSRQRRRVSLIMAGATVPGSDPDRPQAISELLFGRSM